ncbi:MAG: CDP-alcohol phosphatidyltransferase family protein [Saprospiraceae bacterium]|nr:CDP-alcohol phosphatidyltransferase family protein [Bacteroidia bacterium]NNE14279.1 CDP-alcohol phosphatidyltransferase family protein [Saprospiraceae bacterium]NNL92966.1 CDP-alcohol phosphatidyltransferase family protein [Saprospiraceae bacterium]
MNKTKAKLQDLAYKLLDPFVKLLIKLGVTPNMITFLGFLITVLSTALLIYGAEIGDRSDHSFLGYAGIIILLAGAMDMVDGRLARLNNQAHPFGALYDSVVDRYSELVMFFGFCYYTVTQNYLFTSLFCFLAMIGSIMVSYTRARAEGLGVNASVGLMQRPERIVLVSVASILTSIVSSLIGGDFKIEVPWLSQPAFETISIFSWSIFFLAISANITALRRLTFAKKELFKQD